ncbi:MAG: dynamin family protein [Chloroflexi bacterium]|nr:dynamin family protein [Chloroflexota bacterium]
MLTTILTEAQAQLLRDEKAALADLRASLAGLDVPRESLDTLQQAILQLDELFLIVVVGEFNAGKSALVNALLGEKVLEEGVTPTTSRVTLVKWGAEPKETILDEGFATFTHPHPLLRELNIVDTPGTNAVIRQHERLTSDFVPRSDLVLFVTSADRPLTESERQFLVQIRDWGKKVVIALNKSDILEDDTQRAQVRDFVLQHASTVLGATPEFFPVSAKMAQRADSEDSKSESTRLRATSGLDVLVGYITQTLDDTARLRLKFANPLGVAEQIVSQASAVASAEADALQEDRATSDAIDSVITAYERELHAELGPRLAEVETIVQRLKARGLDFFDSTIRLTRIFDLARGDAVRAEFEKQVLADVPAQIDDRVRRLIDWLVEKDLRQWQQIMTYLQRRQARYTEHIVGEGVAPLDVRRRSLIDTVGHSASTIVDTYDRNQEASELAAHVEAAVTQTALLEAGAVGLSAVLVAWLGVTAADLTGFLAAGTMALIGFFVIPYKRRQAKEKFTVKIDDLRARLLGALETQFTHESENAVTRMKDGVAPYTRFVRAERERADKTLDALGGVQRVIEALKARVQQM